MAKPSLTQPFYQQKPDDSYELYSIRVEYERRREQLLEELRELDEWRSTSEQEYWQRRGASLHRESPGHLIIKEVDGGRANSTEMPLRRTDKPAILEEATPSGSAATGTTTSSEKEELQDLLKAFLNQQQQREERLEKEITCSQQKVLPDLTFENFDFPVPRADKPRKSCQDKRRSKVRGTKLVDALTPPVLDETEILPRDLKSLQQADLSLK
ncbi:hypothetical protein DNTS_012378, partial [Danionella cerebrum]